MLQVGWRLKSELKPLLGLSEQVPYYIFKDMCLSLAPDLCQSILPVHQAVNEPWVFWAGEPKANGVDTTTSLPCVSLAM